MTLSYVFLSTGLLGASSGVVLWSEHTEISSIYPAGIDGALQHHLAELGIEARATGFDADNPGLTAADLEGIDVLVWFGHRRHDDVPQALADAIDRAVRQRGMGFVALHSAHFSRPFRTLMGTSGAWQRYSEGAGAQRIEGTQTDHPIWRGMHDFVVPQAEMYVEPFIVPEPESVVASSRWSTGEVNREVLTWTRGRGRVVYLATGHETHPIFHQPEIMRLVQNAITWARQGEQP